MQAAGDQGDSRTVCREFESVQAAWLCTGLPGGGGVRRLKHWDRTKEYEMSSGFILGKD